MSETAFAKKILDYWYLMERLGQDPLPKTEQPTKNQNHVKERVALDADVLASIQKWKEETQKAYTGRLTFYIGRTEREACIGKIAALLGRPVDAPERSTDEIAWCSLQLTPDGKYVEGSFSLSPVLWAMKRLQEAKGGEHLLTADDYETDVAIIEQKLVENTTLKKDSEDEIPDPPEGYDGVWPTEEVKAAAEAACMVEKMAVLAAFEQQLLETYVRPSFHEATWHEDALLAYRLWKEPKADAEKEQDDYHGLYMDFFSEDLSMVRQALAQHPEQFETGMGAALLAYITSVAHKDEPHDGCINVVPSARAPMTPARAGALLSQILDICRAPLGKWPSKYQPALMQQMAINLFTHRTERDALFGKNGPIFSVNGPPGTGKTTLLKEIVVHNIVERAHLLASYKLPDEAFELQLFQYGKEKCHGYGEYCPFYYRLKNPKIGQYGILVTSCNNAAVENISKELPIEAALVDTLPEAGEGDDGEVKQVFDLAQAPIEMGEKSLFHDIYFSHYATRLLSTEQKKVPAWGLVAAPLGKRKNIDSFGRQVLRPLHFDFLSKRDVKNRLPRYREQRKRFLEQWNRVKHMQEALAGYAKGLATLMKERDAIADMEQSLVTMKEELHASDTEQFTDAEEELLRRLPQQLLELSEQLDDLRSKYKMSGVLFFKKRKACAYNDQLDRQIASIEQEKTDQEALQTALQAKKKQARFAKIEKQRRTQESETLEKELKQKKRIFAEQKATFENARTKENLLLVDDAFLAKFLSSDPEESKRAQVTNPGFNKAYDRARERLFYEALRLHKEFVLSSEHCADNIENLLMMWGVKTGKNNERIVFDRSDRQAATAALLQTLWLLVPVISSTFASVGRFLRDVKKPQSLGTLIVDEAGQAPPQMAVGALYRFQQAMIVGDPKQVEPVVTDDLDLLKKAIDDPDLLPYEAKSNSVQQFADQLNAFGTYLYEGEDNEIGEWIGCPLLVHRRCIDPMYTISNMISYNGIMKLQTAAPKGKTFACESSGWLQVDGKEKGSRNHFVEAQAIAAKDILLRAFALTQDTPSLYIISPFTTVTRGIENWLQQPACADIQRHPAFHSWCDTHIGTVHTFQGKEADEVLFVLGCDATRGAEGAVRWVNSNIVNVAATRAKYRLVVIGDRVAWQKNMYVRKMMEILDAADRR